MWNMPSGIKRKSYDVGPCPPEASARLRKGAQKRDRVITGLATDPLNRIVIASTLMEHSTLASCALLNIFL
jgi:U3 small nucleolar RNA-associated protein 21